MKSDWTGKELAERCIAMAAIACSLSLGSCGKTEPPAPPPSTPTPEKPSTAGGKDVKSPAQTGSGAATEAALVRRVRGALEADARTAKFGIDLRQSNGIVELFGTVDTRASRQLVERIVAGVEGVVSVKNHIVVGSGS